jgi:hypothetical protein
VVKDNKMKKNARKNKKHTGKRIETSVQKARK